MVTHKWFRTLILVCCLAGMAFTSTHHNWVKLGERKVNHATRPR